MTPKTEKQKEEDYRKRLAKVRARLARLKESGLCLRCAKYKANRGEGATPFYCPPCAEKGREYARRRYRELCGRPISTPPQNTGRPMHKPFKVTAKPKA